MIYNELQGNLFDADAGFALAHCVSADCAMGAGIALEFRRRFPDMPAYCLSRKPRVGEAVLYEDSRRIFNLVTKQRHFHKPTYDTLTAALADMKRLAASSHTPRIAMPLIGCGLDRLQWDKVRPLIHSTFEDTDVEIAVYRL